MIADRLYQLREERARLEAEYGKMEHALESGAINQEEYGFLLKAQYGGLDKERSLARVDQKIAIFERHAGNTDPALQHHPVRTGVLVAMLVVLIGGLIAINGFLGADSTITGLVTIDATTPVSMPIGESFTADNNKTINVSMMKGLQATGTLLGSGTATISAVINGVTYVVATVDGSLGAIVYTVTSDKSEYSLGETVTASIIPNVDDVTYYAYLGDESQIFSDNTYVPAAVGEYRLDAIITVGESIFKESTTFIVIDTNGTNESGDETVSPVEPELQTTFDAECIDTCNFIDPINGEVTIFVTVTEGTLELDELTILTPRENSAPFQIAQIPDITIENGVTTVDLNIYFEDPDGDTITYEINNMIGVEESIDDGILTLTSVIAGTYETYVYASDTMALTQSNTFSVVVPAAVINDTNSTETNVTVPVNETEPINETYNGTYEEPVTNVTINDSLVLDCSDPDPNKRPLSCLQEQANLYFREQLILLEDLGGSVVARVTPIGNLLIGGEVIEYSSAVPNERGFTVSKTDVLGRQTFVSWVDDSGNLHLRGALHEEQLDMNLAKGSYSIQNAQSVQVLYFNRDTGDLFLRGNVIPFRKEAALRGEI